MPSHIHRKTQNDSLYYVEDQKLEKVPGTKLLSTKDNQLTARDTDANELKRRTGRYSHIVLIPQPSDNPHDPYVALFTSHWIRSFAQTSQRIL